MSIASLDQTVDIGTDVASFFLFHPDDLAHRKDDPLDWYSYGFACRKEFKAGNLVAFTTGSDGGYQLRITGGDLTAAEQARQTGSWEWGYTVRHGKVFVDNGDYLPSEEAFDLKKAPEDQWVTVPNGDYRVTIYPIEREDNSLPDYVIRFEPVDKPLHIANSPAPPDLIPLKERPPKASEGGTADAIYEKAEEKPLARTYPLLVAADTSLLPGGSASVPVADELFKAVRDEDQTLTNSEGDIYVVLASSEKVPGLGMLAWVNGWSEIPGKGGRISLRGERPVRITKRTDGKPLPVAWVEPVERSTASLGAEEVKALQAAFTKYAARQKEGQNSVSTFDQDRVAAMTSGKALTTRLIELLPLSVETRFRLQAASDAERAKELLAFLDSR
jgi:hypothetical protein